MNRQVDAYNARSTTNPGLTITDSWTGKRSRNVLELKKKKQGGKVHENLRNPVSLGKFQEFLSPYPMYTLSRSFQQGDCPKNENLEATCASEQNKLLQIQSKIHRNQQLN